MIDIAARKSSLPRTQRLPTNHQKSKTKKYLPKGYLLLLIVCCIKHDCIKHGFSVN